MPFVAGGLTQQREFRNQLEEDLRCEFITEPQRLYEIENDWRELWSSLSDATPFQSPDWLLPWWQHYGEGHLFSFAFWRCGKLVGFAPLYIYTVAAEPRRNLFLLGTGNSDYLDIIVDPALRVPCWHALLAEIKARSDCWDVCSFQRLRTGSPLLNAIAGNSGLREEIKPQVPCVAMDLHDPGHGEVLLRRSKTYARKLQKAHSFTFEEATSDTLDAFSEALERLHQQRWQEEGYEGALRSARDRSFHREVARRFLRVKMLMFYGIRMGEDLIAVIYGYRVCDRIYSYLSGFDPEYARKSVGAISIGYAVERAMQSGCHAFDFLQGQEPYKYTWGARDLPCHARRILKSR
jgi:CelD/BcsL family acetyltransferase involved in cellulose biosynthesis